ncbi:MAG TPA: SAM-dependent methyltransferase, partial [Candidatus Sulfotelmatobacter sp.]|nr:SAM-dependent methyltransferase [Candidatus Sulfotelmatobacter sp.]
GPPDGALTGAILANELLDALPVHRLARLDGRLAELYVAWQDGWFADEPLPPADPALEATLAASGIVLAEGARAEVSLAAQAWVREAAASLARGWLLLIDYGGAGADVWRRHPEGLLRTYRAHHAGSDPYRAVGRQDLTAHVDTSAVRRAALASGLEPLGETTLAEFMAGLRAGELLVDLGSDPATTAERYRTARGALLRLLDPGAMGRFAVIGYGRGMAAEPPLRGFDFQLRRA